MHLWSFLITVRLVMYIMNIYLDIKYLGIHTEIESIDPEGGEKSSHDEEEEEGAANRLSLVDNLFRRTVLDPYQTGDDQLHDRHPVDDKPSDEIKVEIVLEVVVSPPTPEIGKYRDTGDQNGKDENGSV